MKRTMSLVLLGAAFILAACTDSTAPRTSPVGSLSVTLSGAQTGQYDASGARPVPARNQAATFASAIESPVVPRLYMIVGYRGDQDAGRQDALMIQIHDVTGPGEYLASGTLAMGISIIGGLPVTTYRITSGTVRITSMTRTRIVGEFSAQAIGGPFAAPPPSFPTDIVEFTAGTFDVPITR